MTATNTNPHAITNSYSADDLKRALAAWSQVVGESHVRADDATIAYYARTTLPRGTKPAGIVRPDSTAQVVRIVEIANRYRIPLHPISRGKNWGYGDACASTDGQVIVDLGRMNRITEVNRELAYAVIEPGVTQGQMYEYLRDHDVPLILDVTGAGPDASIIGNTLERGFGHTPYGNHYTHMCGLEVVLRDGRTIHTGYGALQNSQASRVFPWGLGPSIDGLFTQSDLGIVTQMGIWLVPRPEAVEGFAFTVARDEDLERVVEAVRELRLSGVVPSTVHIANDLRVISARRRFPWEATSESTRLPDDLRAEMRREAGIGAWNVMGGLYGTRGQVAAARRAVKRRLRGMAHVHTFSESKIRWARRAIRLLGRTKYGQSFDEMVTSAESVYKLLIGQPTSEHLGGVFWGTRPQTAVDSTDPVTSGSMWLSPVFPLEGTHARRMLDIAEPIWREHGFSLLVTLTAITERAGVAVLSVCFDHHQPGEPQRAAECYKAAFEALAKAGYFPYRLGLQSAGALEPYRRQPPQSITFRF
ncbi:MAG: FAD-binding oxidoreductase [Pirellulaceae bacterium]